jgi:protein-S-isoprenylcysteine O-methyltransferase Ste14
MSPLHSQQRSRLGALLVTLQFALMVLLPALALPTVLLGRIPLDAIALAALSAGLFLWTLAHNRLGNFNIRPTPKPFGVLVTTGPYRLIRHPMYSAVLLGAASLALMSEPVSGWSAWTALALVLLVKSTLEERWLAEVHPDYGTYRRTSWRFVPWMF